MQSNENQSAESKDSALGPPPFAAEADRNEQPEPSSALEPPVAVSDSSGLVGAGGEIDEREGRALDALIALALHPDSERLTAKVEKICKDTARRCPNCGGARITWLFGIKARPCAVCKGTGQRL